MKKWAKILVWIGIIWVILVLCFDGWVYITVNHYGRTISQEEVESMSSFTSLIISSFDWRNPFENYLQFLIGYGIPAWILFIISGIWGREKQMQNSSG